jgi:hypothetical protein
MTNGFFVPDISNGASKVPGKTDGCPARIGSPLLAALLAARGMRFAVKRQSQT